MQQIQLTNYGTADVMQAVETNMPTPHAGEVLVQAKAIGVNYSDILRRRNTYFMPTPLPYVLGTEVVGTVVALGTDVNESQLAVGTKVLAILPAGGGYAEAVCAPAQYCVPLPPTLDEKVATALFVQGSTAHLLIHQVARELAGKTVLICAAAGGVGSLLVQLAKLEGATVIAAASSDEKLAHAQALGADHVINYSQDNWVDAWLVQTNGQKVDYLFEMVGGKTFEQGIEVLTPGGSLIVYGAASGEKGFIHSERFVDQNQHLLSFNLAHYIQHQPDIWQASLGTMMGLVASGKVQVVTPCTYPLTKAIQAHRDIEARRTTGKVVLVPNA